MPGIHVAYAPTCPRSVAQGGLRTRLCSPRAQRISISVGRSAWLGRACTTWRDKISHRIKDEKKKYSIAREEGHTHRDLRTRYQDGIGESWACAEERNGAGLM